MSKLVELAVEEILGEGAKEICPLVGAAIILNKGIYAVVSDAQERTCKRAQSKIGCTHLEVCATGWGTPTSALVEYAFGKKGCAFLFEGVPLGHFQANLDVSKLSSRPIRFNSKENKVGYYQMQTGKCRSCYPIG